MPGASGAGPSGGVRYDRIGVGYSVGRRTDPTWAAAIANALGKLAIHLAPTNLLPLVRGDFFL